jgi:hypothetical protein
VSMSVTTAAVAETADAGAADADAVPNTILRTTNAIKIDDFMVMFNVMLRLQLYTYNWCMSMLPSRHVSNTLPSIPQVKAVNRVRGGYLPLISKKAHF